MPSHTSPPPNYRGEAGFWDELLRLDDGEMHFWYGVPAGWGIDVDVLLLVPIGAFCIEVKALPLDQIAHLELRSLVRKDGAVCPSPFGKSIGASRALAATLDRSWENRPALIPVAAFPLVCREEWIERFREDPVEEYGDRCILKEDLVDIFTFRDRLFEIAALPVDGRSIKRRVPEPRDMEPNKMHHAIYGDTILETKPPLASESDVLRLLDEVIALVTGPGAVYESPGAKSLNLWRAALDQVRERSRLRVSVVGEFKSGKSSLINAILGRDVCYVDEFEATQISATYTDDPDEGVKVLDQQNRVEQWPIQIFLDRCAKRQMAGVRQVTVLLPTGLPYDIVDSPGLGSNTSGHAEEAEVEVRRSDLLLWAVDSNDAGSAREGAFIKRAREIGLPIIVLLTKSDVLEESEIEALVEYLSEETNIPKVDIIPVSAHKHQGVARLKKRLLAATQQKEEYQEASYSAKVIEAIDGSRSTLRFLMEVNGPHARYLSVEREYLESSAFGIGLAAKAEWLRVLREECAQVATSIASKSIDDPEVVELMLRKALPGAVSQATTKFLQSLRRLVREEWRGALEERSREFEGQLAELLVSRPDAKADLDFLQSQSEAFRIRAEIVDAEIEPAKFDNRLLLVGLGAAASVVTVSILPIAVAAVIAAVAMRERKVDTNVGHHVDAAIASQLQDVLVNTFESVAEPFERAIDRIVTEVAEKSLANLLKRRGGPDIRAVMVIENKAPDLMDELAAIRSC